MRPVLYLDIDDTLLSWAGGSPRPVPDTERFLRWAMGRFEVRWLSKWCPAGELTEELLGDLSKMVGVAPAALRGLPACSWEHSGIKVDGIAWLEHAVLGRDFVWVENREGVTERDLEVLRLAGWADRYLPCNVTEDPGALAGVRQRIEGRFAAAA